MGNLLNSIYAVVDSNTSISHKYMPRKDLFIKFLRAKTQYFLFSFFLFIYLFLKLLLLFFLLYNIVLVLPYINRHPPRVYTCSHPEPPSHLPPHTIPLGHPSAPAPSFLYPASNLDWRFISYMILYKF